VFARFKDVNPEPLPVKFADTSETEMDAGNRALLRIPSVNNEAFDVPPPDVTTPVK
jgi:hypothetical protein